MTPEEITQDIHHVLDEWLGYRGGIVSQDITTLRLLVTDANKVKEQFEIKISKVEKQDYRVIVKTRLQN